MSLKSAALFETMQTPSLFKIAIFALTPKEKPPKEPSLFKTRWQGT